MSCDCVLVAFVVGLGMPELTILGELPNADGGAELLCRGAQPGAGATLTLLEPANALHWRVAKVASKQDGTFTLRLTGLRMMPHANWRLTF